MNDVYSNLILKQVPRLLGLIDRNKHSPTHGCFDRQFWHYRVLDFPCARMQEAALTLALLYKKNYPQNIFYGKDKIRNLSIAAINFWGKIQNKNGSFSEWYPNEHSFVATAFTTYAISEACLLLNYKENIREKLIKAGEWLAKHNETLALNQQAGAACALITSI